MKARKLCLTATMIVLTSVADARMGFAAAPDLTRMITPEKGRATVVLYRDNKLAASALDYRPYLNDVPVGTMPNGTWLRAEVPPGSYDLWLEQYAPKGHPRGVRSRAVATYTWKANQIYFIKVDSVRVPGLVSRAKGTSVNRTQALSEIPELTRAGEPLVYPMSPAGLTSD